jgi:hypothetical protein
VGLFILLMQMAIDDIFLAHQELDDYTTINLQKSVKQNGGKRKHVKSLKHYATQRRQVNSYFIQFIFFIN